MSMNFQEIAAIALDEWELGERGDTVRNESGSDDVSGGVVAEAPTEDAKKGFYVKQAKANFNAKPPKTPQTPKTETAQAQNTAQKPLGQQLFDLAKHDKSKHGGRFDPDTMSCKFRKEMAKSMTAMGLSIPERVKQELGEKNVEAAKKEGHVLQKNDERVRNIQNLTKVRDQVLAEKGKDSEEYKKACEDVFNARMEFARQMIGDDEADAGEGLIEIATDETDPDKQELVSLKVDRLFDKAMNGEFNEAQNAELLAIGSKMGKDDKCKALEDKLFKPDSGVDEEQMKFNAKDDEQNEAIREQMRAKSAETEPDESDAGDKPDESDDGGEKSGGDKAPDEKTKPLVPPSDDGDKPDKGGDDGEKSGGDRMTPNAEQPKANPDDVQKQALEEAIAALDLDADSDELSDYEKDKRRTAIANQAARYLEQWSDLDDPEKREAAVQRAIEDYEQAKSEGRELDKAPNEHFEVNVGKGRGDLTKELDKARENLEKVLADKSASNEEKLRARGDFNEARRAHEERTENPTDEDLLEDRNAAKEEFDKASGDLDDANAQLARAEEALNAAKEAGDKDAIRNAQEAVDAAQNAVDIAEQSKNDAKEKLDSATEAFENYEPPKNDSEMLVERTREALEKAGISPETLKRFDGYEALLRGDPDFFKNHPMLLDNFRKDAEAWTRIKTDSPAMQDMQRSLIEVAADDIKAAQFRKTAKSDYAKLAKSKDPDIAAAAKAAQVRLDNGEDPYKVHKDFADEKRKIEKHSQSMQTGASKERRAEELHSAKMEQQMANNAKSAAQAFAAEAANRNKFREEPVAKTDPEIVDAVKSQFDKEEDPSKRARLQNILRTLNESTENKSIDGAIEDFEKGWSDTAKDKDAVAKFKAKREMEDKLEKTWSETNKDGRLKDLDAAIKTLSERKDDASRAAAARLDEIRGELGTSHSSKRTEALLKEWSNIVTKANPKKLSDKDYDLDIPDEADMTDSQREISRTMDEAFAQGPTEDDLEGAPDPDPIAVAFEKDWAKLNDDQAHNRITVDELMQKRNELKDRYKAEHDGWEKPEYDAAAFAATSKSVVDNLDSAFGNLEQTANAKRKKEIDKINEDNRKTVESALLNELGFKLHPGYTPGVNAAEYTIDTKTLRVDKKTGKPVKDADGNDIVDEGNMTALHRAADQIQREIGPNFRVTVEELSGKNQSKIKITATDGSLQEFHSTKELFNKTNLPKINRTPCPMIRGFGPNGEAEVDDMTKTTNPHGMFLGGTGSGKTELLEANIQTWLTKDPRYVTPMLLDGKGQLAGKYRGVKGMTTVAPKDITLALKKLIKESHRRADLMAKYGIRDIAEWNSKFPDHPMPYVPVAFDEVNSANIVNPENDALLGELSRISRASGIHVLATAQELGTKNGKPGGISTGTRNNMTQGGVTVLKSDKQAAINAGVPEAVNSSGSGDGYSLDGKGNKKHVQGPYSVSENKDAFVNWLSENRQIPTPKNRKKSAPSKSSAAKVARKDGESDADYIKRLEAAINGDIEG